MYDDEDQLMYLLAFLGLACAVIATVL